MKLILIGAPTDIGASVAGYRLEPGALHVAGIGKILRASEVGARDAGDVTRPPSPQSPPVDSYRHLPEVIEWNRAVCDVVAAELADGRMPVLMDGDHSLAIGGISAIAAYCRKAGKRLRVIWVGARADINTNELTPSGNIHGMPMACLLDDGPEKLASMSDRKPAIEVDNIRQVGLRSVDPGEKRALVGKGLEVLDTRLLDETGMWHTMERALYDIDEDIHIHLSLDLGFVNPQVTPGAGTPVVGGSTYREVQLAVEMIAGTRRLDSIDLVGISPTLDIRNTIAELAVDLVESLFGKSTLFCFIEV